MENNIMDLVKIENDQVVTTSLKIAEVFETQHKDLLEKIRKLSAETSADCQLNYNPLFVQSTYIDNKNREQIMYYLNRDAFTELVGNMFGEKARKWKRKYYAEFNRMEQQLKTINRPLTYLEAMKELVKKEEERLALEAAYKDEKKRADENQDVKDLYDTSVAQNNYWIEMKAVADILDVIGIGRTNLYRFLRDEGVLTSKNEPMRQYQELGLMKTSYYSDWLGQYVCVVSFKGLKFIFKKLKHANKIPRSTTFEDWVALCRDMAVENDKSESMITE